jgi:hypothetical protein
LLHLSTLWRIFARTSRHLAIPLLMHLQYAKTNRIKCLLYSIGRPLRYLREYPQSLILHRKTWRIKKRTLGNDHPSTLWSYANLGAALFDSGKKRESTKITSIGLNLALSKYGTGPEFSRTLIAHATALELPLPSDIKPE